MKKDTNKFLKQSRVDASKIELSQRTSKFIEIYQKFDSEHAANQSERCLECGNPYCQWKCPVHNYIPVWLKMVLENRVDEAVELSHQTNSFPEICGRVCPQDRLCEGSCTLDDGFGAVTIGNVEKYITDSAFAKGWRYTYPQLSADAKQVAIIGAGPAGLACADVLLRSGVKPVIFERSDFIGGLLTYGIPAFKLEKDIIQNRYQILLDAGAEFHLACEIGRDINFAEIVSKYSAVFIATGTYKAVTESSIPVDGMVVLQALDYLSAVNRDILAKSAIELQDKIANKNILVLGGGDTAMDCIRTSLRLGAKEVTGVYRRSEDEMPGSKREYVNAKEEGAAFEFNAQPVGLTHDAHGVVNGVKFIKTMLVTQENGKTVLEHVAGSEYIINADIIITAFGFKPEAMTWLDGAVSRDNHGRIKLQNTHQQLVNNNIYSGGDVVRGASLVVNAIADGMQAAREIITKIM